jgi:hypothetical protein
VRISDRCRHELFLFTEDGISKRVRDSVSFGVSRESTQLAQKLGDGEGLKAFCATYPTQGYIQFENYDVNALVSFRSFVVGCGPFFLSIEFTMRLRNVIPELCQQGIHVGLSTGPGGKYPSIVIVLLLFKYSKPWSIWYKK